VKTWEMVKELTENDNLKFKAQDGMTAEVAVNGCLMLKDSDGDEAEVRIAGGCCEIEPDRWELIPQEVTWQEAIQRWLGGETIVCEIGLHRYIYTPEDRHSIMRNEIEKGKWYIE
jgi:hypothetical protein